MTLTAPQYTWTFSEKSLLIRIFRWVYAPNPNQMTFCKLFWGVVVSPVTLPLRILFAFLVTFGKTARWGFLHSGVPTVLAWYDRRNTERQSERQMCKRIDESAYYEAQRWSWRQLGSSYEEFIAEATERAKASPRPSAYLAGWQRYWALQNPPEPVPPKQNVPSKIAEWVALQTDRAVAFVQGFKSEHPRLLERCNVAGTVAGKVLVRGVFYPLMILLPATIMAFGGWQVWQHWHGGVHGLLWAADHARHWLWVGAAKVGLFVGIILGTTLAGIVMMTAIMLPFLIWDKYETNHVQGAGKYKAHWLDRFFQPKYDLRSPEAQSVDEFGRLDAVWGMYQQGWKSLSVHAAPLGRTLALPLRGFAWLMVQLFLVVCVLGKKAGRGALGTAGFFAAGHHAVKYRTCPRIEIVKEEAA